MLVVVWGVEALHIDNKYYHSKPILIVTTNIVKNSARNETDSILTFSGDINKVWGEISKYSYMLSDRRKYWDYFAHTIP